MTQYNQPTSNGFGVPPHDSGRSNGSAGLAGSASPDGSACCTQPEQIESDRRDFVRSQRAPRWEAQQGPRWDEGMASTVEPPTQPEQPTQPVQPAQPDQSAQPAPYGPPYAPPSGDPPFGNAPQAGPFDSAPQAGPFAGQPVNNQPVNAQPYPQPHQPATSQPRNSGVQILLLVLGVGLITAAVVAFASSMVTAFGDAARVTLIGLIGLTGLIVSRLIAGRLRVTAEGVAWAGLAALGIDAALVGDLGALRLSDYRYPAVGGLLLLTVALAFALRMLPVRPAQPRSDAADSAAPRPLRAYGLYAAITLPWATAMVLGLPFLSRAASDAITAVCLAVFAAGASLMPHAPAAPALASAPASAPAKPPVAERIMLLVGSMVLLMAVALGDFDSSLPGLPIVAVVTYALMLAVTAATWMVPAPVERKARSARNACRWITGSFTGLTALSLMVLAVFDADRIIPADLVTALFGLMALAIGAQRMASDRRLRSWTALWPGLTFLFAPTLFACWVNPAPVSVRSLLLLAAALVTLLAGAYLGWQAPVTAGAAVLIVHVLRQLWPWLVRISQDYWWIWLLAAGVVLVAAAARYEASLKSVRSMGRRISQLR